MIRTAIKHYIYEKCIEVFFDSIITNFKRIPTRFKIGERYTLLIIRQEDQFIELHHCTVLNINANEANELIVRSEIYKKYDLNYKMRVSDYSRCNWAVDMNEITQVVR